MKIIACSSLTAGAQTTSEPPAHFGSTFTPAIKIVADTVGAVKGTESQTKEERPEDEAMERIREAIEGEERQGERDGG